jgi:GMP synthase-like glutamine amidotransferase
MSRLPTKYDCLQWHGGEVIRLPNAAEVLPTNEQCIAQAFRWGDRTYGFQYHVKPTETTRSDWAGVPAHRSSRESALGANACLVLDNLVSAKLPEFAAAARQLNDGFLELISKSASPAGSNGKLPQPHVPRPIAKVQSACPTIISQQGEEVRWRLPTL